MGFKIIKCDMGIRNTFNVLSSTNKRWLCLIHDSLSVYPALPDFVKKGIPILKPVADLETVDIKSHNIPKIINIGEISSEIGIKSRQLGSL